MCDSYDYAHSIWLNSASVRCEADLKMLDLDCELNTEAPVNFQTDANIFFCLFVLLLSSPFVPGKKHLLFN